MDLLSKQTKSLHRIRAEQRELLSQHEYHTTRTSEQQGLLLDIVI